MVYAGSEAALIQAFQQAEENKKPVIGYFYEPQWFLSEVPLVKVDLPQYTDGCDADPAKVACDYPPYHAEQDRLQRRSPKSSSPASTWSRTSTGPTTTRTWSRSTSPRTRCRPRTPPTKWIDDNPDKVDAWLK